MIQLSCANHPQDSLTLKIQYQPEKKYHQITERTSQTIIKYAGSEKSIQKLKDRGIQNPTITNRKSKTETVLKTGQPIDGKNFPVTMKYIKSSASKGKIEIPDGTIFHGQFIGGDVPVFDSVEAGGLDAKDKRALIRNLQNTFSQLSFHGEKLKIGEQFSGEKPLSIPMEGSTIEMVVTTNYKLISISNHIARFNISQVYTMSPKLMDNSFKGTGNGKGQLLYDITNKVILNYAIDTEMELNKKLDSFDFELKAKSGIIQTTNVSNNQ